MRHPARLPAAVALLLLLGFLWLTRLEVAVRFPESYYLPDRTRNIGVLVGWSAVLAGSVAVAARRRWVVSRWWSRLSLGLLAGSALLITWLIRVDARDFDVEAATATQR